jgi:hypothetical protein
LLMPGRLTMQKYNIFCFVMLTWREIHIRESWLEAYEKYYMLSKPKIRSNKLMSWFSLKWRFIYKVCEGCDVSWVIFA